MSNWFEEDEGRLYYEKDAVEHQFPQFDFDDKDGLIIIKGALKTDRDNYYYIKLVYPDNYPISEPEIFCEGAEIDGEYYDILPWFGKKPDHVYSEKHLCWNDQNRARTWDPEKSTAVVALATIAVWFFSYESYVFDNEKWLGSDH